MLIWLSSYLSDWHSGFHVLHYITVRAIFAALTALTFSLCCGGMIIRFLASLKCDQAIRQDGPQSHLTKVGTPTMGGLLILIAITVSTLLWANCANHYVLLALFVAITFGCIGWVDDYRKVVSGRSTGLPGRWKFFWQSTIALFTVATLFYLADSPVQTTLIVPFFKQVAIELSYWYLVLGYFVLVGSSNAVNLTDGLDGLAILPTTLIAGAFAVFAYLSGHVTFAHYLAIPYLPGVGELSVICAALVGAGLGFLWFNSYPAQVFMGDVGALALGALLGFIAIAVRQELVLFIMGGVFVAETLSVILQVSAFKLTGKRLFRMAPLHHHFELAGWPEPKVIVRFWIITVVLVLIGLATLKIR